MSEPNTHAPIAGPAPGHEEFNVLCDAVFDGVATADQVARLEAAVLASPALRQRYVELADQEASLAWVGADLPGAGEFQVGETEPPTVFAPPTDRRRAWVWPAVAAHTAVMLCLLGGWVVFGLQEEAGSPNFSATPVSTPPAAVWAASAGADLFGGAVPAVGEAAPVGREQALLGGWVKLRFASGAEAVLEGPAVFEIAAADRLILRAGRCSVHAPDGAEGFRVDTPDGRVVDLGTRFAVRVRDGEADGGTEVHVVEGAATLEHDASNGDGVVSLLEGGQADRLSGHGPLVFDPQAYRESLPDRVVSYVARDEPDGATVLKGLTVQRDGRVRSYGAAALIPAAVVAFHAPAGGYPYAVPTDATGSLGKWLSRPFVLNAGFINPGGASEPLSADPVLDGPDGTPGLAVRFDSPVTNGPGPDLVLFDIQSVTDVPDGDAFHLSPATFRPGLRSHTVRRFDLTLGDPGTAVVAPFILPKPAGPVSTSAADGVALDAEAPRLVPSLRFTANAVAIDLSDLGYGPGETVGELFIQDARDDPKFLDPTVIVGLPTDSSGRTSSQHTPDRDTP
ncbi:FecR family protein [Alienimonas chondri]|uniref:FecR protein domain-containing protein n=1 Tax=Alienimonas chondri TaxID=2681879 RepID=A0ABX1VBJ7_9PLAN|nr:FecR family protein [Alienimonas chondri]NNJ25143.1 hypothetical protein [Alienimonas chondri]